MVNRPGNFDSAESVPKMAVAHFDTAFDLVSRSKGFGRILDISPDELARGPHFADILGLGKSSLPAYDGGQRRVKTSKRGVNLKLLRGQQAGRVDTQVGDRVMRTEIQPLANGTIVTRTWDINDEGSEALQSRQEREDEARRMRRLLETSPTGVMIARESDGAVLFANSRLGEMIGVSDSAKFFRQYGDRWLFQDRQFLIGDLKRNGRLRDFELELTAADGSRLWFLTWIESIQFEGEQAILYWCHDITRLKESESKLAEQALYDTLTGLPNRSLLVETLRHNMASNKRQQRVGAVLFLDLDGFKPVNDTYGHDAGDFVLQETARRLRQNLRSADRPCRLAGDEFVVVLHDLTRAADAGPVAEKLINAINQPIPWRGHELYVAPSVGIALFDGNEASGEVVISAADQAMYRAKEAGKGTYRFAEQTLPGGAAAE